MARGPGTDQAAPEPAACEPGSEGTGRGRREEEGREERGGEKEYVS